jgi:hypothetical protein
MGPCPSRASVLCDCPIGDSDLCMVLVELYEGGRASRLRSSPVMGLDP